MVEIVTFPVALHDIGQLGVVDEPDLLTSADAFLMVSGLLYAFQRQS